MSTLCEGLMLACFGLSWPLNVVKSLRARSARGKSLFFEIVIICGYLCGIFGKLYAGAYSIVLALYFINLFVVSVDLALTIRNKRLDMLADKAAAEAAAKLSVSPESFACETQQAKIAYENTHIEPMHKDLKASHLSENTFIPSLAQESLRQLR